MLVGFLFGLFFGFLLTIIIALIEPVGIEVFPSITLIGLLSTAGALVGYFV